MLKQKRKLRVVFLGAGFGGLEISARLSARIGDRLDLTLSGMYGADVLVIALGADYDIDATPGLSEAGHEFTAGFNGKATCFVEFGEGKVGSADVDFFTDPYPTCIHYPASAELSHYKRALVALHKARWFRKQIEWVLSFSIPIFVIRE